MQLIKKIYQSEPFPWNILFGLVIGFILLGNFIDAPACDGMVHSFLGSFSAVSSTFKISAALLVFIISFVYRNTIRESNVLEIRERVSPFPIALFALTALFSCNGFLLLLSVLIITLLFRRLVQIKEDESQSPAGFESGLLVALVAFISPYFLGLMVFVIISLSSNRTLSWRAIIWSFVGLCTPFYLYLTINFIHSGNWQFVPLQGLWTPELSEATSPVSMIWKLLFLTLILAMFILMLMRSIKSSRSAIVRRRKVIRLGISLFSVTAIISFLIFQFEGVHPYFSIISVPLAVLFIELNKDKRSNLDQVLFVLWLIFTGIISWI